jgi:predicted Na+-dependent transporter
LFALILTTHLTGLAMFCCMPTTLSSGVTLTQLVGGNTALALAMTAISNLLGIMIVSKALLLVCLLNHLPALLITNNL